jgi:hypothetical protein
MKSKQTQKEEFLALSAEIVEHFSIGELNLIYNEYLRGQIIIRANNKALQQFLHMAKSNIYPSKDEIAMILTHLIIEPKLLKDFIKFIPQHVLDLMQNVVWTGAVPAANPDIKRVEDITTLQFSEDSVLPSHAIARPEYSLMAIQEFHPPMNRNIQRIQTPRFLNVWFYLPPLMTNALKRCIDSPEPSIFEITNHSDEFLASSFYSYQNNERTSEVFTELSAAVLHEISPEEINIPGALLRKKAKSIINLYDLPEFYPNIAEYDTFSFQYLSWLIIHVFEHNKTDIPSGFEAIQYCYKELISGNLPIKDFLLHFLHDDNHPNNSVEFMGSITHTLQLMQSNKWIQVDSMIIRSFMHGHVPPFYNSEPLPDDGAFLELSSLEKPILDPIVIREAIHPSLFKGVLAILASLGIIDILLQKPSHYQYQLKNSRYLTIADGIMYVRLTEMGEYIIGKKKPIATKKKSTHNDSYLLDNKRLIITIKGDSSHRSIALSPFASPMGTHIFSLNPTTFLKGCHSISDIERKIVQFKQIIHQDLPDHFTQFFQQLLEKANPLIPEPLDIVFKLKNQGAIAELFAQDSILKSLVKRAEGFRIIIAKSDVFKLKKRLEELGYFME